MIGTPKDLDTKNKDLEDLEELNPPLPAPVEKKDAMNKTFGQEEEEEECEHDVKTKSLSDFIEIIIKVGK
jgi:hypothetical protein